ncbi:MAG: TIGR03943 family protein [bacterium]
MNASIRSLRDSLLLLIWGFFVLWLHFSKLLPTYIHPSLQPYTVGGGVFLIILAFFSLRGLYRKKPSVSCSYHDQCCSHAHDHEDHDHHQGGDTKAGPIIFKTAVLLLPLAVVLIGQNNHYTMSTINNRGIVQDLAKLPSAKASSPRVLWATLSHSSTLEQPKPDSSNAMPIQVIDLLYAVQMPTYREDFEGKMTELIGQFVPLSVGNPKGDRFQVIRLFITCCAADAKPVGVTVQYDGSLKVPEMGWVKITGIPTFPMEGGRRTAVLKATKVEECPAPSEPFVY